MGYKLAYSEYRVEVEPVITTGFGGQPRPHASIVADCEHIAREIRRHVDDLGGATVLFKTSKVCEHCSYAWEDPPECCDKAIAEHECDERIAAYVPPTGAPK